MGKEPNFKFLTAKVISVSEHENAPFTMELERESFLFNSKDAITIDPRCTFYKKDKIPKTVDIVKAGDKIKVTYILYKGVKVAFNVIVLR